MPNLSALVAALSSSVVAGLTNSGQFPLTDGAVLLGKQHDYEHSDAPRIIFTPIKSTFGAKDVSSRLAIDSTHPAFERVIGAEMVTFEVRCWGRGPADATGGTDPNADYDATQALYQQVIASVNEIALGCYDVGAGEWNDDVINVRRGREFVFQLSINTPVYERLTLANLGSPVPAPNPPSNYVPAGTTNHNGGTVVTLTDLSGNTGGQNI